MRFTIYSSAWNVDPNENHKYFLYYLIRVWEANNFFINKLISVILHTINA